MATIHEQLLGNDLQLLCCPLTHLHSIEFSVYFKGGALYENRRKSGHLPFARASVLPLSGRHEGGRAHPCAGSHGGVLSGRRETYAEGVVFRLRVLPRFLTTLCR